MTDIIEPASELQDIALIVSVVFCFILVLIAIWFATQSDLGPAFFSMTGAAFLVFAIWAIKGVFRK